MGRARAWRPDPGGIARMSPVRAATSGKGWHLVTPICGYLRSYSYPLAATGAGELSRVQAAFADQHPETDKRWSIEVRGMKNERIGGYLASWCRIKSELITAK